jgi:hypothetical protein
MQSPGGEPSKDDHEAAQGVGGLVGYAEEE